MSKFRTSGQPPTRSWLHIAAGVKIHSVELRPGWWQRLWQWLLLGLWWEDVKS